MGAQGVVVLPGQGPVWNMSPGRSAVLKLLGGATGGSSMMFEETVPGGTKSTFHLHHDSDEVAYVLSGEVTFKIGDEVTVGGPGTCAFMPRGVPHAWKNSGPETGRVLFLYTPAGAGGLLEGAAADAPPHRVDGRPRGGRVAPAPRLGDRRTDAALNQRRFIGDSAHYRLEHGPWPRRGGGTRPRRPRRLRHHAQPCPLARTANYRAQGIAAHLDPASRCGP